MAQNGVRTSLLSTTVIIDDLIGNRNGSTVRIPIEQLAQSIAAFRAPYNKPADLLSSTEKARGSGTIWLVDGPFGQFCYEETADGPLSNNALPAVRFKAVPGHGAGNVLAYGALGKGTTNDKNAINACLAADNEAYFPRSRSPYIYTGGAIDLAADGVEIHGDGILTEVRFTSHLDNVPSVKLTGKHAHVHNIYLNGSNNATAAGTAAHGGCSVLWIEDTDSASVHDFRLQGGHYGCNLETTTGDWSVGLHHNVRDGYIWNCASMGFRSRRTSYLKLSNVTSEYNGTDGFKFGEVTIFAIVSNCHANFNKRDGFDCFDGFPGGLMISCIARGNKLQGFEVKATHGGGFGYDDYTARFAQFTMCIADENERAGWSCLALRDVTFTACFGNNGKQNGWDISSCQKCAWNNSGAFRNAWHGFNLFAALEKSIFMGCRAHDNSWIDGVIQNALYEGFYVGTGVEVRFVSCSAQNDNTVGQRGGQGFGLYFDSLFGFCVVDGWYSQDNIYDGIGGVPGWAAANFIHPNINNNGVRKIVRFTDDALTVAEYPFAVNTTDHFAVNGTKVIGAQGAAVSADATTLATALALINELKARLEEHGLIAS